MEFRERDLNLLSDGSDDDYHDNLVTTNRKRTATDDNDFEPSIKKIKKDLDKYILGELGYDGDQEEFEKLSKKQKKKLAKRLEWKIRRPLKKEHKKKMKTLQKGVKTIKLFNRKAKKLNTMEFSECKLNVVIDLSFDELMSEKDHRKCIQQINRCYAANRNVKNPLQFHITTLEEKSLTLMKKNDGFAKWDIHFHQNSYLDVFDKQKLVYLTSDSENVIEKLDNDKVYVIGGLVDHNAHKNMCYRIACDQNIAHGRLPLEKFIEMRTRKVLAINHVFEIMVLIASSGHSWEDAFLKVLPQRKGALLKENPNSSSKQPNINNNNTINIDNEVTVCSDEAAVCYV